MPHMHCCEKFVRDIFTAMTKNRIKKLRRFLSRSGKGFVKVRDNREVKIVELCA